MPKNLWNLETHFNFTGKGTREWEGPVAPTNHQSHLTFELTRGITDYFELAGYLLFANRPGYGVGDYAGVRVRPRFRIPQEWTKYFSFSLSTEVGFPNTLFEENSVTLELRPIIERNFGRLQLDFNPTFARALHGPGAHEGWEFEPAARVGWAVNKRWDASFEYYGATGPLTHLLPLRDQGHQFYPGADINLNEHLVWNLGFGIAATPAGNQFVFKTRLGWLFGRGAH